MNAAIASAVLVTCVTGAAHGGPLGPVAAGHARIVHAPAVMLRACARDTTHVTIEIARGLHIQANPAGGAFLVPVEVSFDSHEQISIGPIAYPPAARHRIEQSEDALLTYDGTVSIAVPVHVSAYARPGTTTLPGVITYQACDSRRCFAPRRLPVELRVVVTR
jgi:DsbC/DsbD-like thiol-disulfide interchange protein